MRIQSRFYDDYAQEVCRVRDCLDGQRAIKRQGQAYLPRPDGLSHNQYQAYLTRALYLGVAERALSGLTGIALRRDPVVELPERLAPMLESATVEGNSLDMLVEWTLKETLSIGYSLLLLDFPRDGNTSLSLPNVCKYRAEEVLDYRVEIRDGVRKLTYLRIQEGVDDFSDENAPERHIVLEADPVYSFRILERTTPTDGFIEVDAVIPQVNGQPLFFIPAVFPSPANLDPTPEKPPFADLCDLSISHYQNSADLEHMLYLTASPTPFTKGPLNENNKPTTIGAGQIWHLGSDGDAGFLEPKGGGISHLREHMAKKEEQMAAIAARFLTDGTMNRNETHETARLRTSGELSLLRGAIRSTEVAIRKLLRWSAEWTGTDPEDVRFEMSKDLLTTSIDPKMLSELSKALMAGQISFKTFVENLQAAEIIPRNRTVDDEREMIE
ncbi:MAG: DUF4055 domain-containing protein, partial [Myxococcota bacterium]